MLNYSRDNLVLTSLLVHEVIHFKLLLLPHHVDGGFAQGMDLAIGTKL